MEENTNGLVETEREHKRTTYTGNGKGNKKVQKEKPRDYVL